MDDLVTLGRAESSRGEVLLRRRSVDGRSVEELVVNGAFAMDSEETSSERQLGRLALGGRRSPPRVLVGGLGLGYTVAELLAPVADRVPVRAVDVVELEPALVDWAVQGLTPTLAAVAADVRVHLHTADVQAVLTGAAPVPAGPWDAILLDVDNGPDFLIHQRNDSLYTEPVLRAAYGRLNPGGRLAVWCQGAAPQLLAALAQIGPSAAEHLFAVARGTRRFDYAVYTLDRPAADGV